MAAPQPADHDLDQELAEQRQAIDRIDQQLVALLSQRSKAVHAIGEAKTRRGLSIFVPHREQEVFQRVCSYNQGPLPDTALRAIWREIMSASIALEQPITICHFGKPGAFTHQAARLKFGDAVGYSSVEAITTVFHEVERGHADYGVVPIENSTDGGITDTIDAFLATTLQIVNELHLRIRHHLMARGQRADIRRIYSKNTVFGQCRTWLATNMPGVELVEVGSTTAAMERAVADAEGAAIGSAEGAGAFGLPVLAADIEDNPTNTTRFVVIARPDKAANPTDHDKTSIMFGVQDRPGALYECLIPFHQAGISLTRIESRPSRRQAWEYLFFIDVLGHRDEPQITSAMAELSKRTSTVQILGSYPRAERPLNG
ncbi:MAG: prephenate dehydratase [Planctomycetota bacterium]|nr:MAG: prephenate dehydratase [Planctomycetota bacterium]